MLNMSYNINSNSVFLKIWQRGDINDKFNSKNQNDSNRI